MSLLWSRAHKRGQVHPHRQDIVRVGVHIHSQGKLHIWCLNVVNSGAVHGLYDGPDLREWQMEGESWNLKLRTKKKPINGNLWLEFINVTLGAFFQLTSFSDSVQSLFSVTLISFLTLLSPSWLCNSWRWPSAMSRPPLSSSLGRNCFRVLVQ